MDLNLSSTTQTLAPQAISLEVLIEKYAKGGERNVAEVQRRVAQGLAQAEAPEQRALGAERFEQALSAAASCRPGASSRRRHAACGHADQLLRAAGGRQHLARPRRALPASTPR
jgi:hypothetical protein